jgi:hypothetical protein
MTTSLFSFKLALLAFWGAWFAIVFLTNLFSVLKDARIVGESWRFASKNYEAVVKAVSVYRVPPWVPRVLFLGVIAWELAAAGLFGWAFEACLHSGAIASKAVNLAFGAGIALWAAFMLADELTLKYAYEQSHELLFIAQLASLMAMYLLPG